ncbi:MAG: PGF-pre-PGF domain-containing protein, partial [Nanoarchaeota archaeon]
VFWYFPVGQASPDAVIVILTAPESNQNITNTSAFIFKATTNMSAPDMTWQYYSDGVWSDITVNGTTGINNTYFNKSITLNSGLIPDGNYTVRAVTNNTGIPSNSSNITSVTFDFNPPAVTIGSPYADQNVTTNTTPVFTFSMVDHVVNAVYSLFNCQLFMNDTMYAANTVVANSTNTNMQVNTSLPSGGYVNEINCTDYAGLEGTSTRYITIDVSDVQMVISVPADNWKTSNSTVAFSFTPTDDTDASFTCNLTVDDVYKNTTNAVNNALTTFTKAFNDDTYYWNITCWDNVSNSNTTTTRMLVVDTTAPSVSLSVSSSSFHRGNSVLISCSASDSGSGVSNTTLTITKPGGTAVSGTCGEYFTDTSETGTYSVSYSAINAASNAAGTTASFTATSTGGGGGGGNDEENLPSMTKSWSKIEPGAAVIMSITKTDFGFSEIRIAVKNRISNVNMKIEKLSGEPADVTQTITGIAYQYFKLTTSNIFENNIEKATIKFKLLKSWLGDHNVNQNTVMLYRYKDNNWNVLTTSYITDDDDYYYYEADTPGFSYFVIAADFLTEPACTAAEKRCYEYNVETCNTEGIGWTISDYCTYECDSETFTCTTEPSVCTPDEITCMGDDVKKCSSRGNEWATQERCEFGCENSACKEGVPIDYTIYLIIVIAIIAIAAVLFFFRGKIIPKGGF